MAAPGLDYMPRTYWQVTTAMLAIGLETPQFKGL
jgi:hypothetical protein